MSRTIDERLEAAGHRCTAARIEKRLSKVALAELAEVSPRTIRRLEVGRPVARDSYARIGRAVGLIGDWWMTALNEAGSHRLEGDPEWHRDRSIEEAGRVGPPGPELLLLHADLLDAARRIPGPRTPLEELARYFRAGLKEEMAVMGRRRARG